MGRMPVFLRFPAAVEHAAATPHLFSRRACRSLNVHTPALYPDACGPLPCGHP